MANVPVVGKFEPVTIVCCTSCNGVLLCSIEKYIQDDDRKEIERLASLGCQIQSLPLLKALDIAGCSCPLMADMVDSAMLCSPSST